MMTYWWVETFCASKIHIAFFFPRNVSSPLCVCVCVCVCVCENWNGYVVKHNYVN